MEKRVLWISDVITIVFVLLMYVVESSIIMIVFALFLLFHMRYFIAQLRLETMRKMDYILNQAMLLCVLFVVHVVKLYMDYYLRLYHNPFGYIILVFVLTYFYGCRIKGNRLD